MSGLPDIGNGVRKAVEDLEVGWWEGMGSGVVLWDSTKRVEEEENVAENLWWKLMDSWDKTIVLLCELELPGARKGDHGVHSITSDGFEGFK